MILANISAEMKVMKMYYNLEELTRIRMKNVTSKNVNCKIMTKNNARIVMHMKLKD